MHDSINVLSQKAMEWVGYVQPCAKELKRIEKITIMLVVVVSSLQCSSQVP